ncbi:MAG TPA: class I SAM-dependent methyltransferase [Chthoniobacteraceae bacterium]|jgi:ubiquinone/menaquinone biosynthesis C-methylase UbiE|nr:class I SAM-dependent methyltransferase [Chthoniobacteraceae bacterium]
MSLDSIQHAAQEQFQKQSHRYAKGHILEDTGDVAAALDGLPMAPGAHALDVATGAGHTAFYLARAGYRVTASDLTPAMLQRVSEGAAERGLAVATREHSAEALPYPDATFDLVTCRVAPHHFSSPADFMRECARVLKPDGWLMIIDGTVPDDSPEAEEWLHEVEKLRDPSHNRLIPPREWRAMCDANGLAVRKLDIHFRKQPDLEWYFETAATSPENRVKVRELVTGATEEIRRQYRLGEEAGKTVWWWPTLTLLAQKAG